MITVSLLLITTAIIYRNEAFRSYQFAAVDVPYITTYAGNVAVFTAI